MKRIELWSGEEADDLKRAVAVAVFMGLRTPVEVAAKLRLPVETVIHVLNALDKEDHPRVRYWPVPAGMASPEGMPKSQDETKKLADDITREWTESLPRKR